jgi:galactokinase
LRDASPEQLAAVAPKLSDVVARRARHVVTEDVRVGRFVEASATGDPGEMGRLMLESHASLRDDYEVSCQELDFLVDAAMKIDGVYGSRMSGCTVTLLRADAAPAFEAQISAAYQARFDMTPSVYACRPSDGAAEL